MTNKEAIKLLEEQIEDFPFPVFEPENGRYMDENIEALHMAISALKDEPKGEWKRMSDLPEDKDDRYECSRCGNVVHYKKRMDLYTFNSWCGRCGSNNNPNRYDERYSRMIILKVANKFPKSCDECPLFVDGVLGQYPFCISKGKYTPEEVNSYEDGALDMYYHGCLSKRPNNCPLEKI